MKKIFRPLNRKIMLYNFKKQNSHKKIKFSGKVILNSKTELEGYNVIHNNVNIENSSVGIASYIGNNTNLSNSKIGKFCSISQNIDIIQGNHPLDFVSTHPSFYSTSNQLGITFVESDDFQEFKKIDNSEYDVWIGNDVWIGKNVTIMAGVNIADGSVVGANALVTKNTEPYSVNVGIPAKCIKYRFDKQTIDDLLESKWWNENLDWIKDNADNFKNPNNLIEAIKLKNDSKIN